jgi:hypothetical protein
LLVIQRASAALVNLVGRPLRDPGRRKMNISGRALFGTLSVAVLGAVGVAWAYWHRGVTVVVRNRDSAALSAVTIHVTGRDYPVGDMPAGSTRRVVVEPTGDSHIEISHHSIDGRRRMPVDCYFGAGDSGAIDIEISRTSVAVVGNEISIGLW